VSGRVVVAGGVGVERIVRYDVVGAGGALRLAETLAVSVAGTAAWASVAAAAAGARPRCVARVGTDPAGRALRQGLARADVDVTMIRPVPGESARLLRSLGGEGVVGEETLVIPGAAWGPGEGPADGPGEGPGGGPGEGQDALAGCQPGDVLLLDWTALADGRALIEAAYARDLQILALLAPYPRTLTDSATDLVDVVVADQAGAAALADAGVLPPSLCVVVGAVGLSWDGATTLVPGGAAPVAMPGPAGAVAARLPDRAYAVLAGTLAARLALGDDRPEAAQAALSAAISVLPRAIPYPDLRLAEEDLG